MGVVIISSSSAGGWEQPLLYSWCSKSFPIFGFFIRPLETVRLFSAWFELRCLRWKEADGCFLLHLYLHFHWAVGLLLLHFQRSLLIAWLILLFDDLGLIKSVCLIMLSMTSPHRCVQVAPVHCWPQAPTCRALLGPQCHPPAATQQTQPRGHTCPGHRLQLLMKLFTFR